MCVLFEIEIDLIVAMDEETKQQQDFYTQVSFKVETVQKLLNLFFKDDKTKINQDALKLLAELLKLFVQEGIGRAAIQARNESAEKVDLEHLEKILPQLLLDF